MLRLLRSEPREAPLEEGSKTLPSDPLEGLVAAAIVGNTDAQRTLMVTVGPSLLKVVRGVLGASHPDVEDTLQEAMVAVHLALPRFRNECTTLHFACRIAVQTAMNARRRSSYRVRHTPNAAPGDLADMARDERSPAEELEAERRREALRQLLCELPEPQAEVLALHSILGHTVEETASATSAPINTVRSRLRNALAKLRSRVEQDQELYETIKGGA